MSRLYWFFCNVCAAGFSGASVFNVISLSGCSACPQGKFGPQTSGNGNTCTECSDGYTTSGTGGIGQSACDKCAVGYYSENGSTACTACGEGFSTSEIGTLGTSAAACDVCAAGYSGTSEGGVSGCTECGLGTFKATASNGGACTECTGWSGAYAGYADSAGQSSCTPCPAHASNCSPSDKGTCNAGYGGSTADGSCTACAIGKFKAEAGNAACTTCGSIRIGCGPPAVVSIINARHASNENIVPTSSVGIPDLSGTAGMVWKVESGTIPFETVDGIPCWNMNAGNLITSTQKRLGDSYTLFYYWKPRVSDSGWRTLHRGTVSAHTYACMKYGSCVS